MTRWSKRAYMVSSPAGSHPVGFVLQRWQEDRPMIDIPFRGNHDDSWRRVVPISVHSGNE
jgi:hypothetical protein